MGPTAPGGGDDGPGGPVRIRFSRRADGDFHLAAAGVAARRQALAPHRWTWLRQIHGAEVVVVDAPGAGAGRRADAAVTSVPGAVVAVHTADCVPVVLADPRAGVVGVAHAGWRGLVAGVLDATVEAMVGLGGRDIRAWLGPHIRARCYEFGSADLDTVAAAVGDDVRSVTAWGTPALDLSAGVTGALVSAGVGSVDVGGCTACEPARYWSHRARTDPGRHAAVAWLAP